MPPEIAVPKLVTDEWPDITTMPAPDARIEVPNGHVAIYVRRVSGSGNFLIVGYLAGLVVAPDARKGGIGSSLVTDAVIWLKSHGVQWAALNCEPAHVPFYQRLGFVEQKNLPGPGVSMTQAVSRDWMPYSWPSERIDYREPW